MCVYCMVADHAHKFWPDPASPWPPTNPPPFAPPIRPLPHITPPVQPRKWTREELDEFEELLRRIKAIEDAAGGCPCEEPGKLDFLKDIRARIDAEEAEAQQFTLKPKPQLPNCS